MATLRRHKEQVWFCKFNKQGNKFATVCKDGQMLIWSIQKVDSHITKGMNHAKDTDKYTNALN
jgi:hypothetical protein